MKVLKNIFAPKGMSQAAASLYYFALFYMVPTAITLLLFPILPFKIFGLKEEGLMWVRLIGLLVGVFSYYYINLSRNEATNFFRWTVHTRSLIPVFFAVFVMLGGMEPILFLFAFGDFFGAMWTWAALKKDGHSPFRKVTPNG